MTTELFELWNTETEQSEAIQRMTEREASIRNTDLRSSNQPQRWVKTDNDESVTN